MSGGHLFRGKGTYGTPELFADKNNVVVGKYCSIAYGVIFDCGLNHNYNNLSTYPFNVNFPENPHKNNGAYPDTHPITKGDIRVGNDVWIGRDAVIMSGVTIGDGAIIGARAIVTHNVEPYSVVVGSPAKHIRYRLPENAIKKLKEMKWWDWTHQEVEGGIQYLMTSDIDGLYEYWKTINKGKFKGQRVGIVTRSMNDELYSKMKNLLNLDFEFIRCTTYHGTYEAAKYLYDIIRDERFDWIINIDEDFFTYDTNSIMSLLTHMIDNEIDYCGMSDGGMCIHRFHSPIVMNPFFNIFNSKKIREALDDVGYVENTFKYNDSMYQYMPKKIKDNFPWVNDNFEPYYPFFYWLPCRGFTPLYLESYELEEDNISTVLKNHEGVEMGIHTWFTREYGRDVKHTTRINRAFEIATEKQKGKSNAKKSR